MPRSLSAVLEEMEALDSDPPLELEGRLRIRVEIERQTIEVTIMPGALARRLNRYRRRWRGQKGKIKQGQASMVADSHCELTVFPDFVRAISDDVREHADSFQLSGLVTF
jgi:hypothetical protein